MSKVERIAWRLIYSVVFVPVSLLVRLANKEVMPLDWNDDKTYWVRTRSDSDLTRQY